MTCIAAYRDPKTGTFWVGADAAITGGGYIETGGEPKIARYDRIIVGASGHVEYCEAIMHLVKWPKRPTKLSIGKAIKKALEDTVTGARELTEQCASLLVFGGQIWTIGGGCWPYTIDCPYYAIGSGGGVATGVLWAAHRDKVPGKEAITAALECAAEHIDSVRGPFVVLSMRGGR